ncbi:MAG: hypothetical protein AB8G22_22075 [Saprospiraceae bacterium]
MLSIHLTRTHAISTSNSVKSFFRRAFELITFKSYRDLLAMDLDLALNHADIAAIYEELYP